MHDPLAAVVERIAPVHDAAIVPYQEIVLSPGLGPAELRLRRMHPQPVEEHFALFEGQLRDVGIAAAAEEKRRPARHRMRAHQGMTRPDGAARIGQLGKAPAQFAGAVAARIMDAGQPADMLLQIQGQRFIGTIHAAERSIAPLGRYRDRIKEARGGRCRVVGHVRVPDELVIAEPADGLTVLLLVRDHGHKVARLRRYAVARIIGKGDMRGTDRDAVEFPEAPAEPYQIQIRQLLSAETHHRVLHPGAFDLREGSIVESADIDALDISPERAANGPHCNTHCRGDSIHPRCCP
jgi:hypothetical protein